MRPTPQQKRPVGWDELPPGWLTIGVILLGASAVTLIFWPDWITDSKEEGEVLAIVSEVVLLATLPFLAMAIRHARRSDFPTFLGIRPIWLLSAVTAVTVLILMEEMSWGQFWLGFETPESFAGNVQNETNMHNFYTWPFEAAYYSAAVVFFVLLPFAWPQHVPKSLRGLVVFVPPPAFAVLALPVCGLFYETWNYAMNQVWFYLGLLIALDFVVRGDDVRGARNAIVLGAALGASQMVFLLFGANLRQGFEMTELREIAIPLAIFAYGLILFARFRRPYGRAADLAHQS